MENLENSISFWRLKYSFRSQLNQTQILFAKHLTHMFVQGLIISGERRAFVGTEITTESDIWQSWASEGMLWLGGPTPDSFFCLIYDLEVKQSSPVHLSLHKLMKQMHYLLLKEQKQRLG